MDACFMYFAPAGMNRSAFKASPLHPKKLPPDFSDCVEVAFNRFRGQCSIPMPVLLDFAWKEPGLSG